MRILHVVCFCCMCVVCLCITHSVVFCLGTVIIWTSGLYHSTAEIIRDNMVLACLQCVSDHNAHMFILAHTRTTLTGVRAEGEYMIIYSPWQINTKHCTRHVRKCDFFCHLSKLKTTFQEVLWNVKLNYFWLPNGKTWSFYVCLLASKSRFSL